MKVNISYKTSTESLSIGEAVSCKALRMKRFSLNCNRRHAQVREELSLTLFVAAAALATIARTMIPPDLV